MNAYQYMRAHGFSEDEASQFVYATAMQIGADERKAQRKINRAKRRIDDLTVVENWLIANSDFVSAAGVEFEIDREKDKLQYEIEKIEKKLCVKCLSNL